MKSERGCWKEEEGRNQNWKRERERKRWRVVYQKTTTTAFSSSLYVSSSQSPVFIQAKKTKKKFWDKKNQPLPDRMLLIRHYNVRARINYNNAHVDWKFMTIVYLVMWYDTNFNTSLHKSRVTIFLIYFFWSTHYYFLNNNNHKQINQRKKNLAIVER